MDIRQFRYFLAVAEEKNITVAAKKLMISQPALSRQIKEIEDKLGCVLFIRKPNGLVITQTGILLQKLGYELIDHYDSIFFEVEQKTKSRNEVLSFGSVDSAARLVMPKYRELFQKQISCGQFVSWIGETRELVESVMNGTIDVGAARWPLELSDDVIDIIKMPLERWMALVDEDFPLPTSWGEKVSKSQLSQLPLIGSYRQSLQGNIEKVLVHNGIEFNFVAFYFELKGAISLARHHLGIAIVPEQIINAEPEIKGCLIRPIEGLEKTTCNILFKKRGNAKEITEIFWEVAQEYKFKYKRSQF